MALYARTLQYQEADLLQALVTQATTPQQLAQRAQVILYSLAGQRPPAMAASVGLSVQRVRVWIQRFNAHGLLGLFDLPRAGRPPELTAEAALRVAEIATTMPSQLGLPFKTWSLSHLQRYLAQDPDVGAVCRETIRRILGEQGISYQQAQRWQQSDDPEFEAKREAIVTCYLDPPPGTLVLCFDQKGPVQFRRYRGRSYRPRGRPRRVPDEYQRHGTGYLLAALNPHTGQVWGRCFQKYNSGTVIWFLGWLLRQLPADLEIVIIWDNASPHSKTVKQWLRKHYGERVRWLHTPKKAAWLNLIEAWLSMFKRDVILNSNYEGLAAFSLATQRYLDYYNARAHPFRWGRKRKKRIFLVGPLRASHLRGRACASVLSDRLARRLAKVIMI